MDALGGWFTSGRVVDAVLALVVMEVIALAFLRLAKGRAVPFSGILVTIAAGASLLLALRAALAGADWRWVALALTAALIAHLADLRIRLRTVRNVNQN
jgi:hypothetical protein